MAALVALIDVATKQVAAQTLGRGMVDLTDRLSLFLVYNTGGAGGYSYGPATTPVNVAVTVIAIIVILIIVPELGRLHRLAVPALAFVSGGAAGNLSSMLTGPAGVADFLAVHLGEHTIVFNLADVALWLGALMLVPVVVFLVEQIRLQRQLATQNPM